MKKKTFSRILSLMLVAFMLMPNFAQIAYGAETPDFEVNTARVEVNPGNEEATTTDDGRVLSYKDAPYVDTSFVDEVKYGTDPVRGAQPVSYSSSSYLPAYTSSNYMSFEQQANIVTPVKDQNPYGTCWSHAAMSVAETNYIKTYGLASNAVNFNEYQHVWYAYNPVKDKLGLYGGDYNAKNSRYGYTSILDLGGNNLISLLMLSNWTGASNASESVFNSGDVLAGNKPADSFAYDDIAHVENAYVLTIPNADYYNSYADMQVDMNVVKQAIRDYGSVTVSYAYVDDYRYNSETFQCINVPGWLDAKGTNHAVTIVGWNDNVPASAFPNGADGNGAWLVKNSWDTWYGYDGYFWLSYYDRSIGMNAVAMDFASADNYDNNYHYDGSGNYTGYVYYGGYDYIYGGNAYVADSAETLEAVGLTTYDVNYNYTIYVYKNVPAGAVPTAGTLATTQSGTLAYAGFHTIDLNQSVSLDAGERYGIVVCYEKPGYQALLCTDMSYSWGWVDFYSYAKAGESYIGLSLSSMEDMNPYNSSYGDGYNVRIKAFTNEGDTVYPPTSDIEVSYRTHVQNVGWQNFVKNGAMSGTSGQALRLEGIEIKVSGNKNLGIAYTTHVQDYGWLSNASNGEMSGTEGESKRLEAIMIQLTGNDASKYDVYYRVHAQNVGWMGWAKNGAPAGTAGYAYRLEGIQIVVVEKGKSFNRNIGGISSVVDYAYLSTSTETPVMPDVNAPNVEYQTHVQNVGWQGYKKNGQMSGTSGLSYRLEGIRIKLTNNKYSGDIRYITHVQNVGWQGDRNNSDTWCKNNEMAGTEGMSYRLEGIQIKLTGEIAKHYDVYYRVHVQNIGWMGWVKNGEMAGTEGMSYRLEGIEIKLVKK